MKKFKKYLNLINESLMDVEIDVNYIYDKYFKEDYSKIKKGINFNDINFTKDVFKSSELKSTLSKEANLINPVKIYINTMGSNFYHTEKNIISVGYNENAYNYIMSFDGDYNKALESLKKLDKTQYKQLSNEFNESSIKGSIHHELVHWIDDSLHNFHLSKTLKKFQEYGKRPTNINMHYIERQGQIHNIKQLKNEYLDIWDEISFEDMVNLSTSLTTIKRKLNEEDYIKWKKLTLKRMFRENLLGENMI